MVDVDQSPLFDTVCLSWYSKLLSLEHRCSGYRGWFQIHYENTPIQIYRKFHLQKLKIFR